MRRFPSTILHVLPCLFSQVSAIYNPLREYAGDNFFNKFEYYGNVDNTTWGNVTYLDQPTAVSKGLTFINGAGNAVVAVDNTTTILPAPTVNRNSIRLTSLDSYGAGSLIIIDAVHIPYGCSVWPSFWTYGIEQEWPLAGEIDIIEAINNMDHNQVALHSTPGCLKAQTTPSGQTGTTLEADCSVPRGCIVAENKPNSFGAGFAQAGGGVYALQYETTGINSWFWSRADIPDNIKTATSTSTMDPTTWGLPSSAYSPNSCNFTEFFPPQTLVLLTTLCGVWAGVPSIYSSSCQTPTNSCVNDNVIGNGSNYASAYWEIRYIRTYLSSNAVVPSSTASDSPSPQTDTGVSTSVVVVTAAAAAPTIAAPKSSSPSSSSGQFSRLVSPLLFLASMIPHLLF
ncbi:concanavalin A-like lectin/glucanase domain-containing protein [Flammula alnicola]|nr:concanavalin A-like lectin/glucanase domain-containing protein [Flammula alnicola]